MRPWSRREFLRAAAQASAFAGTSVLVSMPPLARATPFPDSPEADADLVFPQGVASGDPRPDGFLLWTRVPGDAASADPVEVRYQIAEDEAFANVVREGALEVSAESDFTLRARAAGLEPHRRYWYRFHARGVSSPVGRTRTAPSPDADVPVRLGFASCQDYQGRYYHGWRALADRAEDLDFVLFLGDYIYEYERYPGLQEPAPGREIKMPDGLVIDEARGVIAALTLEDYRGIYRATRSDADLRRIHRLCPFVIVWDDHEHANDAWADHAVDFNDARGDEKDTARREAATRAWFEHLPVDLEFHPERGFPDDIVTWRKLRWGRHLDLFLTDQRYYRDDHVVPEGPPDPAVGKPMRDTPLGSRTFCVKSVFEEREAARAPTMLGAAQREWFLREPLASDATWKVWGSALMVAQFVLDLTAFEKIPPAFRNRFYFKTDQWDGFLTERRAILSAFAGMKNFIVLSGDLHGFYASGLRKNFDAPDEPLTGAEFTVAGISSISLAEQLEAVIKMQPLLAASGLGSLVPRMDENLRAASPHFVHADSRAYGVAIAEVRPDRFEVEFLSITGVREPEWNGEVGTTAFVVRSGDPEIRARE